MIKRAALVFAGVLLACSVSACKPTEKRPTAEQTPPPGAMENMTTIDGRAEKLNMVVDDAEPACTVSIFTVKPDGSGLKQNMDSLDQDDLDAQLIIDLMVDYDVLEEGTEVNEFDFDGEVIEMDINKIPDKDDVQLLTCITNTFIQNYEADSMILSVAGEDVCNATFVKNYKELTK